MPDRSPDRASTPTSPAPNRASTPAAARRRRPLLRRIGIALAALVVLVLLTALAGGLWLRHELRASLPDLEGELALAGLEAPVTIERDRLGVPAVRAASRSDAALALGFLHAQERYFQMDLQRRRAAGELSELFGAAALPTDRDARVHRFRERARRFLAAAEPRHRTLIESYARGVEGGLAALEAPPFEYVLLRTEPAPWRPEDTLLTVMAMFQTLQGDQPARERGYGLMAERLPAELVAFLTPVGNDWDAPLVGPPMPAPPPPGPEVWDLRAAAAPVPSPAATAAEPAPTGEEDAPAADTLPGSNAWAVAGERAAGGGALVANDMHLDLALPNIWYRAALHFPGAGGAERRVAGATLPGAPAVVIGSNGDVAWGFTNLQGDTADLVVVEFDPADPGRYLTPEGPRAFDVTEETIAVAGAPAESFEVRETIWGPVVGEDAAGRPLALSWVAHRDGAVGLDLMDVEEVTGLDQAMAVAVRSGVPVQNFVAADSTGRIGWTVAGRLPERTGGFDARFPTSWAAGGAGWLGLLPPERTPRLADPEEGRIWSANARVGDGEILELLGDGGFVTAARASRIRDRLRELDAATPADMLSIQLDDSAVFLERWRALLVDVLDRAGGDDPGRREARRLLDDWSGHASVDSVAYRLVRGVRNFLAEDVFAAITAPCAEADPTFRYTGVYLRWEGPLWQLVTERPPHLLDPRHESWDAAVIAALDQVLDALAQSGLPLEQTTWGHYNTIVLQHPLSRAVPQLGRWLDLEPAQVPGDGFMPRVVNPGFGSSERMAVSPGREEEGYFHMPGGQSGHPLSPHYRDGHAAWVAGEPTPFLPGPPVHSLRLSPAGG